MKLISQHTIIPVLVQDQDEALHFYIKQLGLEKRSDISFGPGLRLLTVAPRGQKKPELALAHPDASLHGEERVREIMQHSGHWLFVTDNCPKEYEKLLARGVLFVSAPSKHLYGIEAVFRDPYGNTFSLLEASPEARALLRGNGKSNIDTAA